MTGDRHVRFYEGLAVQSPRPTYPCFDDYEFIEQVLAEEARNGHRERACLEQASSR